MQNKIEKLTRAAYKEWKSTHIKMHKAHPDEETLACFLEGRLSLKESEEMLAHLMSCSACTEAVAANVSLKASEEKQLPAWLLERIKNLAVPKEGLSILEVFLRLKGEVLEVINVSGDVLVGQELVPAAILRSRQIKDFKDEIIILKDFKDIRVELKVENKRGQVFSLTVAAKEKKTQQTLKNLRITLLRDDLELESYLAESGKATFEHVLLGKYTVEITDINEKLASILVDIKT